MKLNSWINKQVRKGNFSRKPNPLWVFVLFLVILKLAFYVKSLGIPKTWHYILFVLAELTIVFAVLHWYVWYVSRRS